uniref:hypothetical protein n=1 Tax=Herbidospora sakaeratensis TaxID=564415 RepID=UPI0012FB28CA|nr:hypothetical protein [Herbidospora sakaeratensis]
MHKRSSSSPGKRRKSVEGTPEPDAPLEKTKGEAPLKKASKLTMAEPVRIAIQPTAGPAVATALTTSHQTFTLAGLTATVDHAKLSAMDANQQQVFIHRAAKLLNFENVDDVPEILLRFSAAQTQWLVDALSICVVNLKEAEKAGLERSLVFPRLVRRCLSPQAMARNSGRFELDVIRASGWLSCHLLSARRRLTDLERVRVHNLCNPSYAVVLDPLPQAFVFVDGEDGPEPELPDGVVDQQKLTDALVPALTEVLNERAAQVMEAWPTRTQLAWNDVVGVAGAVERFVYESVGPFPSASPTGPFFTVAPYATTVASTLEADTGEAAVLGMLANRAELIGWSAKHGKPFETAGYHPGRPGDRLILDQVLKGMLQDTALVKSVRRLILVTGRHDRKAGLIFICPAFLGSLSAAAARWSLARTMIHEFMHRLSHPDLLAAAAFVEHDQIVHEGFTDLVALHIFTELVAAAKRDPEVCASILGPGVAFESPADGLLQIDYDEAGAKAQQIAGIVGMDNVMAAFFLGGVHLAGLKKRK